MEIIHNEILLNHVSGGEGMPLTQDMLDVLEELRRNAAPVEGGLVEFPPLLKKPA